MAATIINLPTAARLPLARHALRGHCPAGVSAPRELARRREQRQAKPEPPPAASQQQIADATKVAGVLGALAQGGFISGLCVIYRRPDGTEERLMTGQFEDRSASVIQAFMRLTWDLDMEDRSK